MVARGEVGFAGVSMEVGAPTQMELSKIRKRGLDKPALVNARTAPVRVL